MIIPASTYLRLIIGFLITSAVASAAYLGLAVLLGLVEEFSIASFAFINIAFYASARLYIVGIRFHKRLTR